jgi:DNA-binding NarL/FixJ family response regulator
VTTHKSHLMDKLGIANNAELIRYAIEHKLAD